MLLVLAALAALAAAHGPAWRDAGPVTDADMHTKLVFALKADKTQEAALQAAIAARTGVDLHARLPPMTLAEMAPLVRPAPAHTAAVRRWLEHRVGAASIDESVNGDFITAIVPVAGLSAALGGHPFRHYTHVASGRRVVRAARAEVLAAIPAEVQDAVDVILGLRDFFGRAPRTAPARAPLQDAGTTSIQRIRRMEGNETLVSALIEPRCLDGSVPAAASDCGPALTSFTLTLAPVGGDATMFTFPWAEAACSFSTIQNTTLCTLAATVPPFARLNVATFATFSNGSRSDIYTLPTAFAATQLTTPDKLRRLYNVPNPVGTHPDNSQAIVSFEEQYWSPADLALFFAATNTQPVQPTVVGYNDGSNPGGEANLDVQWITGVGQGVPTTTWSFPAGDYILDWALAVANTSTAPLVTSISYGDTELGYLQKAGYGAAYIARMEAELAKMAARGLTVVAGSGDAGWTNVGEMGNDLSDPDPDCSVMRAFYPSLSPWVLSLSSVFLTRSRAGTLQQAVISVTQGRFWTTGGGFANYTFARQSYQDRLVAAYLQQVAGALPPSSAFNASGIAYADMVTLGDNMLTYWFGELYPLGGTSSSGPAAAGLLALLNDARLQHGHGPIGYINNILYDIHDTLPDAFTDITLGGNNDGDIQPPGSPYPTFCTAGFPAAKGWDPASGLGSPNMDVITDFFTVRHH